MLSCCPYFLVDFRWRQAIGPRRCSIAAHLAECQVGPSKFESLHNLFQVFIAYRNQQSDGLTSRNKSNIVRTEHVLNLGRAIAQISETYRAHLTMVPECSRNGYTQGVPMVGLAISVGDL